MLSAVIPAERSYPAMLLAKQLEHHWFVHPSPLIRSRAVINVPAGDVNVGNRLPDVPHLSALLAEIGRAHV